MMTYPHGSIPYGDDGSDESVALRVKRMICAAVHHHPRSHNGSWCFGYGYVCSRCYMFADPWPPDKLKARIEQVQKMESEGRDFYLGDMCK